MKHPHASRPAGSVLVVTLATVTALSLLAAYTLNRAVPRVRMAYQNAAWQEARVAAEAGVDSAMNDLLLNATGFTPGAWTGWQAEGAPPPAQGGTGGLLSNLLDPLLNAAGGTLGGILGLLVPAGSTTTGGTPGSNAVTSQSPLYLDNVRLSATTGLHTELDIRLWAITPNANPNARWFRIRCMATCALPSGAGEPPASLDAHLRRFSLRNVRPSIRKDDAGKPSTVPLPNVSRTVEVLVEPILSFELALWTGDGLALPTSGTWDIDSFDSGDPKKSAKGGLYPGRGSKLVQANGNIASSSQRSVNSPAGPAIAANGTRVHGAVATNGGDDPATTEHENVSGPIALDPARIHDDFGRRMVPLRRAGGEFLPPPPTGHYLTGSLTAPTIYSIHGNLTDFSIAPAASGETGAAILMVDGNLDLANPLVIPPSVIAVLFVRGDITFRGSVNSGDSNSNRASRLLIFGDGPDTRRQSLRAFGPISICAAFYGPRTDAILDGAVHWIGSLNTLTFKTSSGGTGGIHYDEALATIGATVGFRIARYIEDVRK